jgi:hypothetical protein
MKKGYVDSMGYAHVMDASLKADFGTITHVLLDFVRHHRSYRNRCDQRNAALEALQRIEKALVEG